MKASEGRLGVTLSYRIEADLKFTRCILLANESLMKYILDKGTVQGFQQPSSWQSAVDLYHKG